MFKYISGLLHAKFFKSCIQYFRALTGIQFLKSWMSAVAYLYMHSSLSNTYLWSLTGIIKSCILDGPYRHSSSCHAYFWALTGIAPHVMHTCGPLQAQFLKSCKSAVVYSYMHSCGYSQAQFLMSYILVVTQRHSSSCHTYLWSLRGIVPHVIPTCGHLEAQFLMSYILVVTQRHSSSCHIPTCGH